MADKLGLLRVIQRRMVENSSLFVIFLIFAKNISSLLNMLDFTHSPPEISPTHVYMHKGYGGIFGKSSKTKMISEVFVEP